MAWAVKQKTANSGQKLVLLLLANHANGYSGQCNPSHRLLADECCMGPSTLRKHLTDLQTLKLISIDPVFYDSAQRPNQYNLPIGGQNQAHPLPESGTPPARIELQNLEVKPISKPNTVISEDMFNTFWDLYPRKDDKSETKKWFIKNKPDAELIEKILSSLGKQINSWKETKYIPYAITWLNKKRWEDEVVGEISEYDRRMGRG